MSYFNNQPHSPWRRLVLTPLWSIQIPFLSVNIIYLALLIGITKNSPSSVVDSRGNLYTVLPGVQPWNIINLAIACPSLLLSFIEVVLYIHRDLHPAFFLGTAIFKTIAWSALFVLDVCTNGGNWRLDKLNGIYLDIALGFGSLLYLSFIVSLVYAGIVFHRYRTRDEDEDLTLEGHMKNNIAYF